MDGFHLKTKTKTKTKTPRRFLCCFGFPGQKPDKIVGRPDSNKRKMFQFNSPSAKTVPVDANSTEKVQQNSNLLRPSKKSKFKWTKSNSNANLESNQETPRHQNPTPPIRTKSDSDQTPKERRNLEATAIICENGKRSDPDVVSSKDDTCASKRLSFRRRIDSLRTGNNNSLPSSPHVASPKAKPNRTLSMPSSASYLPQPQPEPQPQPQPVAVENKPAVARVTRKKKNSIANARKVDPIVGMSIIAVTLVIMLLWGRLCAILCTSAWFYFVPRLKDVVISQAAEISGTASLVPGEPDFDSEEHKKKVVLEGLLKRNHRSFS